MRNWSVSGRLQEISQFLEAVSDRKFIITWSSVYCEEYIISCKQLWKVDYNLLKVMVRTLSMRKSDYSQHYRRKPSDLKLSCKRRKPRTIGFANADIRTRQRLSDVCPYGLKSFAVRAPRRVKLKQKIHHTWWDSRQSLRPQEMVITFVEGVRFLFLTVLKASWTSHWNLRRLLVQWNLFYTILPQRTMHYTMFFFSSVKDSTMYFEPLLYNVLNQSLGCLIK